MSWPPVPPGRCGRLEEGVANPNQQMMVGTGFFCHHITSQHSTAQHSRIRRQYGVQLVIRSSSPEWHTCSGSMSGKYLYGRPW
ncbi:hypothetical protein V8C42DRAFT_319013 [Trichoderma barbatum]